MDNNLIFEEEVSNPQQHQDFVAIEELRYQSIGELLSNEEKQSPFVCYNQDEPSDTLQTNKNNSKLSSKDKLILKQGDRFETGLYRKGLLMENSEIPFDIKLSRNIIKQQTIEDSLNPKYHIKALLPDNKVEKVQQINHQQPKVEPNIQTIQDQNKQEKKHSRKKLSPLNLNPQVLPTFSQKKLLLLNMENSQLHLQYNQKQTIHSLKLYPRSIVPLQRIENKKIFCGETIRPGEIFQGILQRNKSGFNRLYPQYHLHSSQGMKHVLSVKKKSCKFNSHYYISTESDVYQMSSDNYFGKVTSNFSGGIFNIYDDGVSRAEGDNREGKAVRELLATVHYQYSCSISFQPRKIEVYIRKKPFKYLDLQGADYMNERNLKDLYQMYPQNSDKIYKAFNRKPTYDPIRKIYGLNFYGKMRMSSVKNMILVGQDDREILLFAKSDHNTFNLDIGYPLETRVAIGIVMSSFDFKWVCE